MAAQVAQIPGLEMSKTALTISPRFLPEATATLFHGDRLDFLRQIPSGAAKLVITSPPYNIGKKYERRIDFSEYLLRQKDTLKECVRILGPEGSLCWEVGNHLGKDGEVFPLDIFIYRICKRLGLKLRNRIVWTFEHGLHCKKRLSGRYETILWFTKGDRYAFNLDPIRVPQKYPGKKYFKGAKIGQYSCNPLGKNPGDVWAIPNVKHNHVEKTPHPCQFPVELVERFVLALTREEDLIVDPYIGVGSTACAAVMHGRRAAGADLSSEYLGLARQRVKAAFHGTLRTRPRGKPIYVPGPADKIARRPAELAFPDDAPLTFLRPNASGSVGRRTASPY
jgi:adenine-specific DNA-methyltransferase